MKASTTIYNELENVSKTLLFYHLEEKQFLLDYDNLEDILFDSFEDPEKLKAFKEVAKQSGVKVATVIETSEEVQLFDDYYTNWFVNPGWHYVNRQGYFLYKLAQGVEKDPFLEPGVEFVL